MGYFIHRRSNVFISPPHFKLQRERKRERREIPRVKDLDPYLDFPGPGLYGFWWTYTTHTIRSSWWPHFIYIDEREKQSTKWRLIEIIEIHLNYSSFKCNWLYRVNYQNEKPSPNCRPWESNPRPPGLALCITDSSPQTALHAPKSVTTDQSQAANARFQTTSTSLSLLPLDKAPPLLTSTPTQLCAEITNHESCAKISWKDNVHNHEIE